MIGNTMYNYFACADDISIFSSIASGLQKLLDICVEYSTRWRFKFNPYKSKCMIVDKSIFENEPKSYIHDIEMCNVEKLEILGNIFNVCGTGVVLVLTMLIGVLQSVRHFYSLSPVGMLYPGASPDVQSYLFKRICQPTITYKLWC